MRVMMVMMPDELPEQIDDFGLNPKIEADTEKLFARGVPSFRSRMRWNERELNPLPLPRLFKAVVALPASSTSPVAGRVSFPALISAIQEIEPIGGYIAHLAIS